MASTTEICLTCFAFIACSIDIAGVNKATKLGVITHTRFGVLTDPTRAWLNDYSRLGKLLSTPKILLYPLGIKRARRKEWHGCTSPLLHTHIDRDRASGLVQRNPRLNVMLRRITIARNEHLDLPLIQRCACNECTAAKIIVKVDGNVGHNLNPSSEVALAVDVI